MPFIVRRGRWVALWLLAGVPMQAGAAEYRVGDLVIQHPWTRATPGGAQVAGGYVTITNDGTAADTLTGGSLEAAARFEIHDMTTANGVMTMRPTGPVDIPPGGSVTLAPSGRHIMFTGLKHGLKKGDSVPGTLVFSHAGAVPVSFVVEGIAAKGPADRHGPAMPGMTMD